MLGVACVFCGGDHGLTSGIGDCTLIDFFNFFLFATNQNDKESPRC